MCGRDPLDPFPLEAVPMREGGITLPELGMIAGTRVALGAGLGLLLASRLDADRRRAVGGTPLLLAIISTVALAMRAWRNRPLPTPEGGGGPGRYRADDRGPR